MSAKEVEIMLAPSDIPGADLSEPFDKHSVSTALVAVVLVEIASSDSSNSFSQVALRSGLFLWLGKR